MYIGIYIDIGYNNPKINILNICNIARRELDNFCKYDFKTTADIGIRFMTRDYEQILSHMTSAFLFLLNMSIFINVCAEYVCSTKLKIILKESPRFAVIKT